MAKLLNAYICNCLSITKSYFTFIASTLSCWCQFHIAYFHFCAHSRVHANFLFCFFCTSSLFHFATFFTFDRSRVLVNATFFFSPNFQYRTLSGSTGVSNFCQQQYCVLFHPYLTDLLWVSCKRVDGSCSKQLCQPEQKSILIRNHTLKSSEWTFQAKKKLNFFCQPSYQSHDNHRRDRL